VQPPRSLQRRHCSHCSPACVGSATHSKSPVDCSAHRRHSEQASPGNASQLPSRHLPQFPQSSPGQHSSFAKHTSPASDGQQNGPSASSRQGLTQVEVSGSQTMQKSPHSSSRQHPPIGMHTATPSRSQHSWVAGSQHSALASPWQTLRPAGQQLRSANARLKGKPLKASGDPSGK
jgi:hypothetical protein